MTIIYIFDRTRDHILLRLKEPPYIHKVIHEIIHLLRGTWPPISHFFLFRVTILKVWGCDEDTVYATVATDELKYRQSQ